MITLFKYMYGTLISIFFHVVLTGSALKILKQLILKIVFFFVLIWNDPCAYWLYPVMHYAGVLLEAWTRVLAPVYAGYSLCSRSKIKSRTILQGCLLTLSQGLVYCMSAVVGQLRNACVWLLLDSLKCRLDFQSNL